MAEYWTCAYYKVLYRWRQLAGWVVLALPEAMVAVALLNLIVLLRLQAGALPLLDDTALLSRTAMMLLLAIEPKSSL